MNGNQIVRLLPLQYSHILNLVSIFLSDTLLTEDNAEVIGGSRFHLFALASLASVNLTGLQTSIHRLRFWVDALVLTT